MDDQQDRTQTQASFYQGSARAWYLADAAGPPSGSGRIYIVLREGEAWFVQRESFAALSMEPAMALALLEEEDKAAFQIVTAEGTRSVTVISEYGFHYLAVLAGLAQGAPVRRLHRWVVGSLLPSIRNTPQMTALPGHAVYAFAELAMKMLKEGRGSLGAMNSAKLLAYFWQNGADGRWATVCRATLAQMLGTNPRSIDRAMGLLTQWGFVERKPAAEAKPWPARVRLLRANVQAALDAFGLKPDASTEDTQP